MPWLTRAFFLLIVGIALAGIASGTACTRRGQSSPVPPTASPLTTISVNPKTGSDTTGNGSIDKPYKTLTKAIAVVKNSTTPGLTIALALGVYSAAGGEKFPIVIPTGMTINGTGYGTGFAKGTYINGEGEDASYEKLIGAPAGSAFTTLEVAAGVSSVFLNNVYVGASRLPIAASASYAALDAMGGIGVSHSTLAANTPFGSHLRARGAVVPSGNLSCTGCAVLGGDAALLAFTAPNATAPVIGLSGQPTQGMIGGAIGIETDGTASIDASFQTFQSKRFGYQDSVTPIASPSTSLAPGPVDFGNGLNLSPGGNSFIGASVISEISVTLPFVLVYAQGDYWNPDTQGSNTHGQYPKKLIFDPGAHGQNVTVAPNAGGAGVIVGPIPPPTPTPVPSGSPSPSPSPT
jgi:hypothetical protein